MAECTYEWVRIIQRRWPIKLTYYYLNDRGRTRVGVEHVSDLDDLREFVDGFEFDTCYAWYALDDGRDRDFPFNALMPLSKLKRIWACLFFCARGDHLDLDAALAMDPLAVIARIHNVRVREVMLKRVPPDRSKYVFKIGCEARNAGASKNELACLLWASAAFQSKWFADRERLKHEVEAIWNKARR